MFRLKHRFLRWADCAFLCGLVLTRKNRFSSVDYIKPTTKLELIPLIISNSMETSPDALRPHGDGPAGSTETVLRAVREIGYGSVSAAILSDQPIYLVPLVSCPHHPTGQQIAGMISKVFEHPFDLTKVRLQSQVLDQNARFKGPIDCLVRTWKDEGIRGLYRVSHRFASSAWLPFLS